MEKFEWRDILNRQPVHYIFFDLTKPMSLDNFKLICQVLQNIAALSNSLKGSSRFSMLGLYILSSKSKCVLPLQSVKQNFGKLQFSLETMQASHALISENETFDLSMLTGIMQDAVKQYEIYFQSTLQDRDEWPQIQMTFFSSNTSQIIVKMVCNALSSIHLPFISKVEVILLRYRGILPSLGSSAPKSSSSPTDSSPILFSSEETDNMISSLLRIKEIDPNMFQIEAIMKQWLHDCSSNSDHLRLTVGSITLRCDMRECILNTDALPVPSQYSLFPDATSSQHCVRPTTASKQNSALKVPVYTMDAVAVVSKDGLCESLLFGHSYAVTATRCWKIDWDELERNQQLFSAVSLYLYSNQLVMLAKKQNSQVTASGKVLPTGIFAFFPSRNSLLVKSVAASELMMPSEDVEEKAVPAEYAEEVKDCIGSLEKKEVYNPLTMSSGLYPYLNSTLLKRQKTSTSFVTPVIPYGTGQPVEKMKRKKPVATTTVSSTKPQNDFITASTLLENKFPNGF